MLLLLRIYRHALIDAVNANRNDPGWLTFRVVIFIAGGHREFT